RAFAVRREPDWHPRPGAAHDSARLQRVVDPLPCDTVLRLLVRRRRPAVHLLQPVHQPTSGGADDVGRGAANGNLRRHRHAAGAHRWRRNRRRNEECGERLHRALEPSARRHLHPHHQLHAGRPGTWLGAPLARRVAGHPRPSRPASAHEAGGAAMSALRIERLCKWFGGLRVTAEVNVAVEPGERRLIIGPNGAGKTTLFTLITGELTPASGSITLFGHDITRTACRRRAHLGIARTYQIITLFPRDTLLRNATLALLGLSSQRWNAFADLDSQHDLIARARAALAQVGLD